MSSTTRMIVRRILKFLLPKAKPVDPAPKEPARSVSSIIIDDKDAHLVMSVMDWCAHSALQCDCADWFIDDKLSIYVSDFMTLMHYRWCVRTPHRNYKLAYSEEERAYLRSRLARKAFAVLIHMKDRGVWESSRLNVLALCIAVADVTEDLSFIFNGKMDVAHQLLRAALAIGVNNRGLLSDLCRLT
jgi:hypothetical protein